MSKENFIKLAQPVFKWQGDGGVELCDVLKAVYEIKHSGLLKNPIAGLAPKEQKAYEFCQFADGHFLH